MTFSKEKDFGDISSLPDELYNKLKNSKDLKSFDLTIGVHKACQMNNDPFFDTTKKLLSLIPGVKIVELNEKCGHNSFDNLNNNSTKTAMKLLDVGAKKGVDAIVCTSPYCMSHLLLCQRQGSWQTSNIKILDVYSLLNISLEGGDI